MHLHRPTSDTLQWTLLLSFAYTICDGDFQTKINYVMYTWHVHVGLYVTATAKYFVPIHYHPTLLFPFAPHPHWTVPIPI